MKIVRRIERRIEVHADELYAALAKHYDLSSTNVKAHIEMSENTIRHHITLIAIEEYEQELAQP